MATIEETTRDLSRSIMREEVASMRSTVMEAIAGRTPHRNVLREIGAAVRAMWTKIIGAGLFGIAIAQLRRVVESQVRSFVQRAAANAARSLLWNALKDRAMSLIPRF